MDKQGIVVWGIGTIRTMRVHWLLREMDVEYETRPVLPRSGETADAEYRSLNPKQKIPCMEHNGFVLTESYAILRYLREFCGRLPYSSDQQSPRSLAQREEWASFILMELDATSLYVMRRHGDLREIYGTAENAVRSAGEYFQRQLSAVDERLPPEDRFLWGSAFSEIDILMATCLDWARRYDLRLPGNAAAYLERLTARPEYRQAAEFNYRQ